MTKLGAKIRLKTALLLARDIQAYRAGDKARFDRMVNAQGKSIISLESATKTIKDLCQATEQYYPLTGRALLAWLNN